MALQLYLGMILATIYKAQPLQLAGKEYGTVES